MSILERWNDATNDMKLELTLAKGSLEKFINDYLKMEKTDWNRDVCHEIIEALKREIRYLEYKLEKRKEHGSKRGHIGVLER